MLPNIDLRIGNLVKALEQVILPALPASQRLARDQVRLVIGHLRMLGGQWKTALRYEEISFEELAALARDLAELVEEPQQRLLTSALKEPQPATTAASMPWKTPTKYSGKPSI
jgi:hypothetical protein